MMERMAQAELLFDAKAALGEGPCWDERDGLLYWVDIDGKTLHAFDADARKAAFARTFDRKIGAAVPRKSGGFVLAMEDGFYGYDPASDRLEALGNPAGRKPGTRFNDGKCDAAGRFWAGTMAMDGTPRQGALYCLETDGTIRTVLEDVSCSNGLDWSPDNRTMYYIDSPTKRVQAFDYDLASGSLSNPRVVVEVTEPGAVPDGMSCDAEGMIWVALWDGYGIRRWNPHTGERLLAVEVPAAQSSSCTFGGANRDRLFITSARTGIPESELAKQPFAGGLFVFEAGVCGQPTRAFGG
ncbi:SMP-30/gluconolaconase/LRE domain protein [Paenibacillus flagellatus]|uniref:SMP-30/gluconolaconase/LRE domain protein n=2 Tax=Paenibacillus flagellatus TaxID=2211139 RepID=A0A2V5KPV0_9BACL|nr:SMP-30/gluconolaconase/LRE domain protein [Paenibacillus flagellatus]